MKKIFGIVPLRVVLIIPALLLVLVSYKIVKAQFVPCSTCIVSSADFTYNGVKYGTATFQADQATDNLGATAQSAPVDIIVSAFAADPVAISNLKVTDTIPSLFDYFSATPSPKDTSARFLEFINLDPNATSQVITLTLTVSPTACADNNIFGVNDATVVWTDTSEHQVSTNTGDMIHVLCPIDIKGDIGSFTGGINNNKITINGPAVAVASGVIDSDQPTVGDVVKLNEYAYANFITDQKDKISKTVNTLLEEATPWDKLVSTDLQNGGDIPLVWKKSGDVSLGSGYSKSGTLIVQDGNVSLIDGFKGSDKPMGIIAQNGNVSITKTSAAIEDENITNVGIYAPNGTVTLNLTNFTHYFEFTGTIVAKKVEIKHGISDIGGSITWSSLFAKNLPPGFTDIISLSTVGERAPE